MDVYRDSSLGAVNGMVVFVAEIGVREGVWGEIGQPFGEGPVPGPWGGAGYEMFPVEHGGFGAGVPRPYWKCSTRNAGTEVIGMMRPDGPGDGSPSLESLHQVRLRALLNDLVHDLGPVEAAERLGIDRKTLWRSEGAGELSTRLTEALERLLLERAVADGLRVRELEERVAELERQLAAVNGDSGGKGRGNGEHLGGEVVEGLRREFAREIQRLERRLEARIGEAPETGTGGFKTDRNGSRRSYPGLVTREPADDDDEVFGAAWPLVEEWRRLWADHSPWGRGLAWVSGRERILELEVAMLEEHGLTLPPETAPLADSERREQVSWRERELARVRTRRARLELLHWLRRVLTLGRWRWRSATERARRLRLDFRSKEGNTFGAGAVKSLRGQRRGWILDCVIRLFPAFPALETWRVPFPDPGPAA